MTKMEKGGCYHKRCFVPEFVAVPLFELAAYDRLPLWRLFFTRRSLATLATIIWWTYSIWLAERLPWFLRKHAINLLLGRNALRDFMPGRHEHPDFDLCVKW